MNNTTRQDNYLYRDFKVSFSKDSIVLDTEDRDILKSFMINFDFDFFSETPVIREPCNAEKFIMAI